MTDIVERLLEQKFDAHGFLIAPRERDVEAADTIRSLRDALEPFSRLADKYRDEDDEAVDDIVEIEARDGITVGDLWRAREALKSAREAKP